MHIFHIMPSGTCRHSQQGSAPGELCPLSGHKLVSSRRWAAGQLLGIRVMKKLCSFGKEHVQQTTWTNSLFPWLKNWRKKMTLKDITIWYRFTLFICGGPRHLSSFKQCSGDLTFPWQWLVYWLWDVCTITSLILEISLYGYYFNIFKITALK